MIRQGQQEIVLEVLIADRSFRNKVEEWLRSGGFPVLNGGSPPEVSELGVVRAAVTITAREREVLDAMRRYDHDHEIAEALFISGDTVQTHMRNLKRKLGVDSRHRLLEWAWKHGLFGQENRGEAERVANRQAKP